MATWDVGCSGCSRRTPGATIAITAPQGTSGRRASRPVPSRMTTISLRCSAMSSAMRCGPSWCREPRTGSGRAYRVGGAAIRCCGRAKSRSAMSSGWSASTSRSLGAICNGCGIRSREADRMARTPGLGRRRYGWGWSRACVPRDNRVRRTCKSAMSPISRSHLSGAGRPSCVGPRGLLTSFGIEVGMIGL